MNTWIFSKNGQVTEPLALAAAKEYVIANQDAYGWQSSYTQWLPVHYISEFQALLPEPENKDQIPQKIVDEFLSKEQALNKYFDEMDQKLTDSESSAKQLAQEIENYKQLTSTLSPEVKDNIHDVEQQYLALQAQLNNFKQVVSLSKTTLSTVANEFNEKVSTKSVKNSSEPQQAQNTNSNAPAIQLKPTETVKAEAKKDVKVEQQAEAKKGVKVEQQAEAKKDVKVEQQAEAKKDVKVEQQAEVKKDVKVAQQAKSAKNAEVAQPVEIEKNSTVEVAAEQKNNSELQAKQTDKNNKEEALKAKKVPTAKVISTRAPKRVDVKMVNTRSSQPSSNKVINTSAKTNAVIKTQASEKAETATTPTDKAKLSAVKESSVEANIETKETATNAKNPSNVVAEVTDGKTVKLQSKLESGVKNIFKSVFTKEEPVNSKNLFAELIEKDGKNDDAKKSAAEAVSMKDEAVSSEDEAVQAPRRRRRR